MIMKKNKNYIYIIMIPLFLAIGIILCMPKYVYAEEGMENENSVEESIEEAVIETDEPEETQEEITTENMEVEETTEQETETEIGHTETQEKVIDVLELDLGEYLSKMTVGDKQLLSVTVIPIEASEQKCTYKSSDSAIASINGMGRIHALSVGKTTITVFCGEISASFTLEVIDKIRVSDIEIADHENEIAVGDTMMLSATIIPADVADEKIQFSSSNTSIATVTSQGEVKGISQGEVIICVSAGGMKKEIPLAVKVLTEGIRVNKDYLVLKPGSIFQLSAQIVPKEAEQTVSYRTLDSNVAEVSETGLVTAQKEGNTSIIVSNSENTVAVSVIVNKNAELINETENLEKDSAVMITYPHIVDVSDYQVIPAEMLYYFYSHGKELVINGIGYRMMIYGKEIKNYKNSMYTDIHLSATDEGVQFNLNNDAFLCGPIHLLFDEVQGKYLYLYNESKNKYEMVQTENIDELVLTTSGKYLISQEKIDKVTLPIREFLIIVGGIICILGGIYIRVKKQYWFW